MEKKFNRKFIKKRFKRFLLITSLSLIPISLLGCEEYKEDEEIIYEEG